MKESVVPKAILFDLDDTILRSSVTPESAWKEACEVSAQETKLFKAEELLSLINTIRDWYWSDPERHRAGRLNLSATRITIVRMALEKLGCANERVAAKIATDASNLREASLELFPNAEDALRKLVKKGVKLALLTNGAGEIQRVKIERFGLARYFHACLIEGEMGFGKPDQRVFETALAKLTVTPSQTWMVGDDIERDIAGAQNLGIFSVWCDFEKKGIPSGSKVVPDKIIRDIAELLPLIDDKQTSGRE